MEIAIAVVYNGSIDSQLSNGEQFLPHTHVNADVQQRVSMHFKIQMIGQSRHKLTRFRDHGISFISEYILIFALQLKAQKHNFSVHRLEDMYEDGVGILYIRKGG